ncbi:hypothetical protein [Streptomyces sp. NPDC050504]|uniref:hypothetical protein n=1 Tax=Streptomyces sp. NPDC050504 TaxID=3365618 RepID=UPI0037925372
MVMTLDDRRDDARDPVLIGDVLSAERFLSGAGSGGGGGLAAGRVGPCGPVEPHPGAGPRP